MNIRKEIQQALAAQDFDRVVQCFEANDAQTTRYLQMHVYGRPDDPVRWTAIDHLGRLAGRYAEDNDALFRNIIRRFIWQMCEESANVPWASAEVVGSIIANVPGKRFEEFIGPLFYHTDLNDICYAGLYWVLPQLMRHHAEKVEEYLPNTYYWFDQFDMQRTISASIRTPRWKNISPPGKKTSAPPCSISTAKSCRKKCAR